MNLIIEWLSFEVPSVILLILGILLIKHDRNKKKNCTQLTKGIITRYSYRGEGVCLPVVEYKVDGKNYKGVMHYTYVVESTSVFNGQAKLKSEKDDTALKISGNSCFMTNPMKQQFPIGSELKVYYNPKIPKQNYVQRFAKSLTGWVCLWTGLGIGVFGAIIVPLITYAKK